MILPSPKTSFQILTVAVVLATGFFLFSHGASAQSANVVLLPDSLSGEFTARVNSATNDARIDRVCLYRVDTNAPGFTTDEVACAPFASGRQPELSEEAPNGEGMVYDITFTTVLVPGEDQEFVARNVAIDTGVEIASDESPNTGRIPSRPFNPVFIIISPPNP